VSMESSVVLFSEMMSSTWARRLLLAYMPLVACIGTEVLATT
jgi:hypothetical protein